MATAKTTAFDPAAHGFQFTNRYSGLDIVGEIHDGFEDVARHVSGSAEFWERWGLCGGMSWHALDRFYDREPVPSSRDVPDADTELFRKIARRQFDSFHGASLLAQCVRWQSRRDRRKWWDPRPTIRTLTLREWAKVKQSVDAGFPASLTLIRTTTTPWENHQVLAVAYEEDLEQGRGEIDLYDPNHPRLTPKIRLTISGSAAGQSIQTTGENLRGFFVWPYDETPRSIRAEMPHLEGLEVTPVAGVVDIHCHNFNADDLPVKGFVRRVGGTKTSLVKLIDRVLDEKVQGYAPGLKEELQEIAKRLDPSAGALEAATIEANLDDEADAIFDELNQTDAELVQEAQTELVTDGAAEGAAELEGLTDTAADIKRFIKWALLFAKPRIRLTEILATTYPEVDLFIPMLVDLAPGLEDSPETSVEDQLEMQSEISKASMLGKLWGAPEARVHPFVGFDPRSPRAVDLVREAVFDFGCVGVKLYPPMGFRPLGNADSPLPKGMDPGTAAAADAAMRDLYEFCVAEQVPITAHGNPTNFADDDYERFSSPVNWRMVLTEFPQLHLNLGHFGGAGKGKHPDWPHQIAALASTFPNLFADIGNHQLEGIDDYMTLLQQLFANRATTDMQDRLMFGTDWFMVASHRDFEAFLEAFRGRYGERFPDGEFPRALQSFMGGAALRFLGFSDPNNKNAQRVAARYQDLDATMPAWLATA